ncbi:hypothetical protein GCM10009853_093560 [Glycomyces scopariae]
MSGFAVDRTGPALAVGGPAPDPRLTGLVEGRGALLLWNLAAPQAHPGAIVWDPALAAEWLWEVYGPDTAAAILDGPDTVATAWDSPVLDAARDLALLRWAEAWWPASYAAAVPALPKALLLAEAAWCTARVEHLLEDEEAVERALSRVDLGALAPLRSLPGVDTEIAALSERLEDLAESYGVVLRAEAPARREDWALAAGGPAPGDLTVSGGTVAVDARFTPRGLVDAEADAAWTLAQRSGAWLLTLTVPAAPDAADAVLTARFAGLDVPLRLDANGAFTGETEAPLDAVTRLAAETRALVHAPWFAPVPPEPGPDDPQWRAAALAFARARLASPDATLTERSARS